MLRRDDEDNLKPPAIEYPKVQQEGVASVKMTDEVIVVNNSGDYYNSNNSRLILPEASFVTPYYPEQRTIVNHNKLQQIQRNIFVNRSKTWPSPIENNHYLLNPSFDTTNQHHIDDALLANNKYSEEMKKLEAEKKIVEEENKKIAEENKELVSKVKLLESQLADMKEKYVEVKQDLRDARQAAIVQKQLMDTTSAASLDRKLSELQAAAAVANNRNNCKIM